MCLSPSAAGPLPEILLREVAGSRSEADRQLPGGKKRRKGRKQRKSKRLVGRLMLDYAVAVSRWRRKCASDASRKFCAAGGVGGVGFVGGGGGGGWASSNCTAYLA